MLFERLLKEIRTAKANLETLISQGNINDFSTYKHLAGQIKGLNDAMEICKNVYTRYDGNDE